MNAINPSLFRSLLASIRALPGSEQIVLEQMGRAGDIEEQPLQPIP